MSVGSPSAFLLWAILACIFQVFLIHHLWSYDKFQCIRWNSGRQPGAFKRVMTYSYLLTLPLLVVFSVAMAALKFKEGYVQIHTGIIIPRPYQLWSPENTQWILPIYFVFSVGWALEMVTHLEELTFWLFLLHQGQRPRQWFHSWEFRTWYLGSMIAILGMPLTATVSRSNLDMCLATLLLVGSSASTLINFIFIYVLSNFPSFIRQVKSGGAEPDVVVRLSTFYQLNLVRILFRFTYTLPLFVLSLDGIRSGPHAVIRDPFWSDFMLMVSAIGCFVSSAITLLIFFPRSLSEYDNDRTSPKKPAVATRPSSPTSDVRHTHVSYAGKISTAYQTQGPSIESTPGLESATPRPAPTLVHGERIRMQSTTWNAQIAMHEPPATLPYPDAAYSYHQHMKAVTPNTERSQSPDSDLYRPPSHLHPYVTNFTSPIDLPNDQTILY